MEEVKIICNDNTIKKDVVKTLEYICYMDHCQVNFSSRKGLNIHFETDNICTIKWWLRNKKGIKIKTRAWV